MPWMEIKKNRFLWYNLIGGENVLFRKFRHEVLDLEFDQIPEFALANGLGGFCSGSITGLLHRKHQGYLVACLNPPTIRRVYLAKMVERISYSSNDVCFDHQLFQDSIHQGITCFQSFEYQNKPTFHINHELVVYSKQLIPVRDQNTILIRYQIHSKKSPLSFSITPWLADRSHTEVHENRPNIEVRSLTDQAVQILFIDSNQIGQMSFSGGRINYQIDQVVDGVRYRKDELTGDTRQDCYLTPLTLEVELLANQSTQIDVVFTIEKDVPSFPIQPWIDQYDEYYQTVLRQANPVDDFERALVWSSDQFVSKRQSTQKKTVLAGIPWFTDWGRDTMIAFEGLFLVTNRFQDAKEVLLSFLTYVHQGLIPNMFPDSGVEPLYNTVDASLWFVHAVYRYFRKTNDIDTLLKCYPALQEIITSYQRGTMFDIKMDEDGLIMAGSGNDQVTWMDVRINGYAVTPRHGKPVEINALWYNALMIFATLSKTLHQEFDTTLTLANKVKESFLAKFWNEQKKCLYDVVDPFDDSIRPNQLYAITLDFPLLNQNQALQVVEVATNELLDVYGIRSLAISDKAFKQVYSGPLLLRDHAYHMGTAWGFLIGVYLEAILKANQYSKESIEEVENQFNRLKSHLHEGCLGGVAEVFDGYLGKQSKGCHNQAWSVAEWLRVYRMHHLAKEKL